MSTTFPPQTPIRELPAVPNAYQYQSNLYPSYPPDLTSYLSSSSLKTKIGAESDWQETNDEVYNNFANTGDWMTNSRPDLETVINAGVRAWSLSDVN